MKYFWKLVTEEVEDYESDSSLFDITDSNIYIYIQNKSFNINLLLKNLL